MSARDVALDNEVLRGVVGSTAHGTEIEGQDDRDEMGVFIEPPEYVLGLETCDHYIYRTKPEGERSGPGDLDLTMYSLRKFCRLAEQGNPTVVVLLWLREHLAATLIGRELVSIRDAFVSRGSGARFLGYLRSQRMRLTGERTRNVSRPELVEAHGYDTKFAMHALRLGYEGIELLSRRQITLPVPEPALIMLRAVRAGEVPREEAVTLITDAEARLESLVEGCDWRADRQRINEFLVRAHLQHWG